jgi:hypothetical protein
MKIEPGDLFYICLEGKKKSAVQAVCSPDGGESWFCCRDDEKLNDTQLLFTACELLGSGQEDINQPLD